MKKAAPAIATRPARPTPAPIPAWAPVLREPAFSVGDGLSVGLPPLLLAVVVVDGVAVEEVVGNAVVILELLETAPAVTLK